MSIFNLFSKRQRKLRGEVPEVYNYDDIPQILRVKIVHIIQDALGVHTGRIGPSIGPEVAHQYIHKALCREYGKFRLGETYESDEECVLNYFLKVIDVELAIDVIEIYFKYIDQDIKNDFDTYSNLINVGITPKQAIEELNDRFKEHGVGYQFEGGTIIKVDSSYAHAEIVKPILSLLWNKKFIGANEEYLKAHEHYKNGRNKECLTECLKAFESTMKIICKEKGWAYNQTDTSSKLIQICIQNEIIPSFTQNQFTSLRNLLESGIPTIRNKLGGHGQGPTPQKVDDEMTRYALNLTGTNIIFLVGTKQNNISRIFL